MGLIRLQYVVSFSSQDPKHLVQNILENTDRSVSNPWLCSPSDKSGRLEAEFQLEKASYIHFVDIGNYGSSIVELLVGRSSWSRDQEYVSLLPTVTMMSLHESKTGKSHRAVRMFSEADLNSSTVKEKWDRIRVICNQVYRKDAQFGLCFLHLRNKEAANCLVNGSLSTKKFYSHGSDTRSPMLRHNGFQELEVESPLKHPSRGQILLNASKSLSAKKSPQIPPVETTSEYESFEEEALVFLTSFTGSSLKLRDRNFTEILCKFEKRRCKLLSDDEKNIFKTVYDSVSSCSIQEKSSARKSFGNIELINSRFSSKSTRNNAERTNGSCNRSSTGYSAPQPSDKVISFDMNSDNSDDEQATDGVRYSGDSSTYSASSAFWNSANNRTSDWQKNPSQLRTYENNKNVRRLKKQNFTFKSAKSQAPEKLEDQSIKDEFTQPDGMQPSTSKGVVFVECPICGDSFHTEDIEFHASTCGITEIETGSCVTVKDEEDFAANSLAKRPRLCSQIHKFDSFIECPGCGNLFAQKEVHSHANICVENCLAY